MARGAVEAAGDSAELAISEMLPTPDQTWLTDAQDDTYVSELRIVAVDPEPWRPSATAG